jgi:DNA invertase Pin-like site-specific DNA recombinase
MNQAVVYARVSSREQEREGYSIPAQLKLLNEYATKHDLKIAKEFTDNETAKKEGRTNFTEMIKFLKQNKNINIILVEKTDRLYRNFKDYVLLYEFRDLEIHLVKEGTILSEKSRSPDKFMHGIKVLMAKNYVDNLSEEIRKGFQEKAEQGEYPVNHPMAIKEKAQRE